MLHSASRYFNKGKCNCIKGRCFLLVCFVYLTLKGDDQLHAWIVLSTLKPALSSKIVCFTSAGFPWVNDKMSK